MRFTTLLIPALFIIGNSAIAQLQPDTGIGGEEIQNSTILTAVPFLTIAPDSRASGMGDVGVATTPDPYSTYWNKAKMGFLERKSGAAIAYNPWLARITNDMSLVYLTGYFKPSDNNAVGLSLRYFDLGEIIFRDDNGAQIAPNNEPKELALSLSYGMKLSETFGIGFAGRYIYSNLLGGLNVNGNQGKPGQSFGVDLSAFYTKPDISVGAYNTTLNFGVDISNLGFKVNYISRDANNIGQDQNFLPANLRFGSAWDIAFDYYNHLTWAVDVNKLLVPSPSEDATAEEQSVLSGIFSSFADAEGGFSEELKEYQISSGLEYNYNNIFMGRFGYHHEAREKGNRKYLTVGAGIRYTVLGFDMSYLLPVGGGGNDSPLANTVRFSLIFNIGAEDSPVAL